MKKKIVIGLVAIVVVMQFFRIDKENPTYDSNNDFIVIMNPSDQVNNILKNSCYDCHSFETKYPWYTNVAPVSWWVKDHINEGRDELNFSAWGTYSDKRKDHKLEEVIELVDEGEMPLTSYTLAHSEASLSAEQQEALISWVKAVRQQ